MTSKDLTDVPAEVREYLGNALHAVDYLAKYRATEKAVTKAISVGAIRSMQSAGWLWIEDRDYRPGSGASSTRWATPSNHSWLSKAAWSVAWTLVVLFSYMIWFVAGPEVRTTFAENTSSASDAALLAGVITGWKVGLLFPYWLIWRGN